MPPVSIESCPISACAVYTTIRITRKPHGVRFLFRFLVFLLFCYCFYFLTSRFVKCKEKYLKCKRICNLLSCFSFLRSGWRDRKSSKVTLHHFRDACESYADRGADSHCYSFAWIDLGRSMNPIFLLMDHFLHRFFAFSKKLRKSTDFV